MKRNFILACSLIPATLMSCGGPEKDARNVCACYAEVVRTEESKAEEKLKECLDLLSDYTEKHKENGTFEEFEKELNICR